MRADFGDGDLARYVTKIDPIAALRCEVVLAVEADACPA
jgi:hypothetical protein